MSDAHLPGPDEPSQIGGYRLIRRLGGGGQGNVYLGRSPSGDDVAVKVLHAWMSGDADAHRRFMREVDVARRVAPFCTAKVLDMGIQGDRPYIVSEYVPGTSLEQLVRTAGPRAGSGLERLAVSTMSALAAIHRAGIVHRDFKPSNIILGPEGPVVIDFGISRALDTSVTRTGSIGTPPYMAPEQFTHEHTAGQSADVFSWACTMVYAATGHRAFPGETVPAVVNAILSQEPDLSGVPPMLRSLLAACLAKNPDQRPASAEVLRVLTGESPAPSPASSSASPEPPVSPPWPAPTLPMPPAGSAAGGWGTEPVTDPSPGARAGMESPQGTRPAAEPPHGTVPVTEPSYGTQPGAERPQGPAPVTRPSPGPVPITHPAPEPATQPGTPERRGPIPRRALLSAGAGLAVLGAAALTLPSLLRERDNASGPAAESTVTPSGRSPATTTPATTGPATSAPATGPAQGHPFGTPLYKEITEHSNDIRSIAVGTLNGAPVAISGGDDKTVRVFGLADGGQIGAPYTQHTGWVRAVAFTDLDGAPVAVTGSDDDTVRVWDLTTRKAVGSPFLGHTGDVKAVAVGRLDNRPIAISGGADLTVRVWDVATGKEVRPAMRGHTGTIWSIAYGEVDSKPVAVTVGDDRTVRVWDLSRGAEIGKPLTGHGDSVRAVAFGRLDGTAVAVTGSMDKTVRVWDLDKMEPRGDPLTGHEGPVWAVAFDEVDGVPIAVTGGDDNTVRVWDLRAGKPLGKPLTGHRDRVWTVVTARVDGLPVAVSGSRDETVRVWSLAPPLPGS
ncbi:protein kinase [Sphaerisporangium sp. NPDC051011]|uniref:protein kinase domain-containing protein n=1 Tax=Sphaerisporangium sp. NPDC051011 TaxID=3155792 RepID=UPI0033F9DA88